jgi:hypothetical protein
VTVRPRGRGCAGLGEGPDDLAPFEPAAFVDALLGIWRRPAAPGCAALAIAAG